MVRQLATHACDVCAAGKRRCDKRLPQCTRCKNHDKHCFYKPSRPSRFVPIETESSYPTPTSSSRASSTETAAALPPFSTPYDPCYTSSALPDELLARLETKLWFASAETWEVYHYVPAEQNSFPDVDLQRYVTYIQGWLSQWVRIGSNQFIHPRLYSTRSPASVQQAFTTLATYLNRNPDTSQMVFRIVNDSCSRLIDETESSLSRRPSSFDVLEHLARVQALLVYQVIGLFDGDIRLRNMAEQRIPVLNEWMRMMLRQAKSTACLGTLVVSADPSKPFSGIGMTDVSHCENLLWYSWILAECIRRTWTVASGAQAIYQLMKEGQTDCMGGMMWTTRRGVFDAQSVTAWEVLCSRVNVGMIRMEQCEELLARTRPEELDDFSQVVLEITLGTERMERWKLARLE